MWPFKREHRHKKLTIPTKPSMTEDQQEKAIKLLKKAWESVSFCNWNGSDAQAIVSFVNEVEGHTNWPKMRPIPQS